MKQEPLTESYFYILLCLHKGPNHGYGIMQEASELTQGSVKIGSGTMYGATSNMIKKKWIQECGSEPGQERRRLYELTEQGSQILRAEISRLEQLVDHAHKITKE